jgi:hypothetical protein
MIRADYRQGCPPNHFSGVTTSGPLTRERVFYALVCQNPRKLDGKSVDIVFGIAKIQGF